MSDARAPHPSPLQLRPLPLLTEINIFLINLAFATLHFTLKSTGLEPAAAAFCMGNLFGIVVPYLGIVVALVHIFVRPLLDYLILYPGAYQSIVWDSKHYWLGGLLFLNVAVALGDKSHCNVKGANFRRPTGIFGKAVQKAALQFWDSLSDYLPMTVVPWEEDATLPANRQYIFACHPHGIHCTPLGQFHSKGTPFDVRFPGICENNISGLAASIVFILPGVREFFLSLPYVDASRHVAEAALDANRSVFVCTGSGEESLLTRQGEDVLVLSRRKGFIRLALMYGCDVVPIFGVGNSDLFKTYELGSGMRMWLQKRLHISIPMFHGRYLTPLPYRVPIQVLVGEPLQMPEPKKRGDRPDDKLVEKYLQKYIERVKELHKNHTTGRKLTII